MELWFGLGSPGQRYPPCFGEDEWEEAHQAQLDGLTEEQANALLEPLLEDLAEQEEKLQRLINEGASDKDIEKQQKKVDKLLEEIDVIKAYMDPDVALPSGPVPAPVSVIDSTETLTPVPGPNYSPGRRSWIDLL